MECRIPQKIGVIVVAGGKGVRVGGDMPKQFRILGQAPILVHTINALAKGLQPSKLVVVLPEIHTEYWRNLASRFDVAPHSITVGGAERFDSVKAGLEALGEDIDIVAIHDGVRPLCSQELLHRTLECATNYGSAIPTIAISDSVRLIEEHDSKMIDRSLLRAVQTPQIFDSITIRRAYNQKYSPLFTDDASVVEALGERVRLCEGEKQNIKITTSEDLLYAQMILENDEDGNRV
ncbi:MAG: 2-C-methyl-D-erythritol 4-phosphate cytidylyltransferase [Rikenellaceae bacterium]